MAKSKKKKNEWIIVSIIVGVLLIFLFYSLWNLYILEKVHYNQNYELNDCNPPYLFECGGKCFSCWGGEGYKLCCNSVEDNWCCPVDKDCDYVNRDCKKDTAQNYIQNNEEDILDNIKQTIVWIKYDVTGKNPDGSYFETGGTGSGVIVRNKDDELTIYTNRHVVDCEYNNMNCYQRISENIQVRTQDGKLYDVDRISFSKSDIDLAILTIKTSSAGNYDFAYYTSDFEIGDKVIAVGYPTYAKNIVEFSVSEGRISNIREVLSQSTGDGFRVLESDVYTYFGSSGGGLFDEEGNLVGINTWLSKSQTSIAIDFDSIKEQDFVYCKSNSYFTESRCYKYCDREEVMGDNRVCYGVCDDFYCETSKPYAKDPRCEDEGYVLGSDGYCHEPCGSGYCASGNICYKNACLYCSNPNTYLWKDGTCRYYE